MLHQGHVGHRSHGFGQIDGEGSESGSETAGEDYAAHEFSFEKRVVKGVVCIRADLSKMIVTRW